MAEGKPNAADAADAAIDAGHVVQRWAQVCEAATTIARTFLVAALVVIAGIALASPDRVKGWLQRAGFKVESLDLGVIKLVRDETAGVNQEARKAGVAVAQAQAQVAAMPDLSDEQRARLLKSLGTARDAIGSQEHRLQTTAQQVGAVAVPPASGWISVGVWANGRWSLLDHGATEGDLAYAPGKPEPKGLQRIAIPYDAELVDNGGDCDGVPLDTATAASKDAEALLSGKAGAPLAVTQVKTCQYKGAALSVVWVKVDVPKDRVRFARFANEQASN